MLERLLLGERGAGVVDTPTTQSLAVAASFVFTPGSADAANTSTIAAAVVDQAAPRDGDRPRYITRNAEEHPVAIVLCCGGGWHPHVAAKGVVKVIRATNHDWRALECV